MKRSRLILFLATVVVAGSLSVPLAGQEPSEPGVTYIIPVRGMIERGLLYVVRRGVSEAERAGAGAIVFDMDTPGGQLLTAEEIIKLLSELSKDYGATVISATHDHKMLAASDRIRWIKDGGVDKLQNRSELNIKVGAVG